MAGNMRLVFGAGIVGALALGSAAVAQTLAADASVAEARIAWAKRHVELVCRPLEAQHLSARAAKCYEEVSLFIADARRPIPPSVAAAEPVKTPAAKAVAVAKPVVAKPVVAKAADEKIAPKATPKRVASHVRPARKRLAQRPVVVASNERVATALAAAQDSVNVKRCGNIPCYRFTTILGVGF